MIVTNLPDLYKLLKGKIHVEKEVTINLAYQVFDEQSFKEFLKLVSKIPNKVQFLDFIMDNNQYKNNYIPINTDFSNLNLNESNLLGLKLEFNKIFKGKNNELLQAKVLAQIGKKFLEKKYESQELSHLELIGQKNFKLILKGSELILHYNEDLTYSNLTVLQDCYHIIQKWRHTFEYIDIKIIDSKKNKINDPIIFEILSFIPNQTKAQVVKLEIKADLYFGKQDQLEKYFYNLNRKDIQIFSFQVVGCQSFKLLNQLKNFNSNLSLAQLYFQQDQKFLEVSLQRKQLIVNANIFDFDQKQEFQEIIRNFRLERIESLKIIDRHLTTFKSILSNKYYTKLQDLDLDIQQKQESIDDSKIQYQYLGTLKKIQIKMQHNKDDKNQLIFLCNMVTELKKLEECCVDIKAEDFQAQIINIFQENLNCISQSLLIFDFNIQIQNQNNPISEIYKLIHVFSLFPQIQQLKCSINSKKYILFNQDTFELTLYSQTRSELSDSLKYISQQKLQNQNIKKIEINITNVLYQSTLGDQVNILNTDLKTIIMEVIKEISQNILIFNLNINFQYIQNLELQLEVYKLIPIFSSLPQIQQFKCSLNYNESIIFNQDTIKLILKSQTVSKFLEDLKYFSQEKLQSGNLKKIELNIFILDNPQGLDDLIKLVFNDLKSTIQYFQIEIEIPNQNSFQFFDFELKQQILELQLILNKRLIIDYNQNYTEINYFRQDLPQFKNSIEDIEVEESKMKELINEKNIQQNNQMDIKGNDEMIIEEKSIDIPNQKKQKDMNKMLFQLLIQQKDECRISCDFSDVEFLKGLLQNFPKSQKVTLSLSNVGITEKEIQVLKNIFQIISSNTKEFNLNISRNSLFNKEAMALFQKLKKASKHINTISINLSETLVRQKGIQNLVKKLSKFKKLKNLELDLSKPQTVYPLQSSLIRYIFQTASFKSMPKLVNLTLHAQFSHVQIDQLFFNSLQIYLQEASPTLKKLHLDFSQNLISAKQINIANLLMSINDNLEYFYLNLNNIIPLQQPYLNSIMNDLIKNLSKISIDNFSLILPQYLVGNYPEKHFWQTFKLFLKLLENPSKNIQITTVNFSFKKVDSMVEDFSFKNLISDINDLNNDQQKNLLIQLSSLVINKLPAYFQIKNQLQNIY